MGSADPPACRDVAATSLILPIVEDSVPSQVDVFRGSRATAELTDALLREGVLRPDDWQGDLASSLQAGMNRWVNEELGGGQIRTLPLTFCYTDNITVWQMDAGEWTENHKGREGRAVGAFALESPYFDEVAKREVFVQGGVEVLERATPGLGYAVLAVVSYALHHTIGAITPTSALDDVEGWGYSEEDANDGYLTRKRFLSRIPEEACAWPWSGFEPKRIRQSRIRKLLQTLLSALSSAPSEDLQRVVHDTLELYALVGDKKRWLDHSRSWDAYSVAIPFHVRWSEDDDIWEVADHYRDVLLNDEGSISFFCWLFGFQLIHRNSLRLILEATRRTMEILILLDRLLTWLDKPVTLVRIFANGQAETAEVAERRERRLMSL